MSIVKDGLKIAIIGAGSGYTPEIVEGFIKTYHQMPVKELWFVDIEEGREKLEVVTSLSNRIVKKSNKPIHIISTFNRKDALKEADFVLTQFRVGQLTAREKDENIPLKYETIGQETNGPGELFKAFRTIPVMIDIANEMSELCPKAWLINFANPAGMLSEAVLNHTSWKRIVSICNGPLLIKQRIANALGVAIERLFVEIVGLNHLVFAKRILLDGKDVTSNVVKMVAEGVKPVDNPGVSDWDKDFLLGLNMIPMSYLEYYWKSKEVLEHEKHAAANEGSRAVVAKSLEKKLFEVYRDETLSETPEILKSRGGSGYSEAACGLIYSLYNDQQDIQTVNVQNNGAIKNLSDDAVVEVNCIITNNGPIPLSTGELPASINGIIQAMKSYEQVACEAAVSGNYQRAMVAMTINPLVSGDREAKAMLNELLLVHEEFLPQFDLQHLKED
ncbi:6-phospho-beta-glucosidase [Listeria welshimeri]|uniref:6-phospho-beta-glucosidase n=1 Tax=Listeria welshimeri TaxID=1643 RepID=UPI00188940DD|nr:6-phospho-beta-glucosidase [Listeria welshimeri]MBF2468383.1 6-phospho-beta-glucosidase [Listeria welshimeri]MBF2686857.1 6-phospho-beta-glucosidase [Listeria welshimeri]